VKVWAEALRASELLLAGEASQALPMLNRIVRASDSGWPLLLRARAKVALGRERLAVGDVTRAFDRDPECGWIFDLPVRQLEIPTLAEARALYAMQRGFAKEPASWPIRAFVGKLKFGAGAPREGLRDLEWAINAQPRQAYLHAWHAEALRRMGKPAAAERAARRALKIDKKDGVAYVALAAALRVQGHPAKALVAARKAERLMPGYEVGFIEGARACLALKDYPGVLGWLDKAVRRANRYGWRSLYEKFPHDFKDLDAMAAAPKMQSRLRRGKLLAWRGEALLGMGQVDQALPVLEEACRLAPEFAWGHAWHAWALDTFGHTAQAEQALNRALKLDPKYARARLMRARRRLDAGQAKAALADADAALKQDDTWARTHVMRVHCLLALKRLPAAMSAAEEALKLDPDYREALSLQRRIRSAQGYPLSAQEEFSAATAPKKDPTSWDAAEEAVRGGDLDGAAQLLGAQAFSLDDVFSPSGRHDLLYTSHPNGRAVSTAALRRWQTAARRRRSGELWTLVGTAHFASGDYLKAAEVLGKALGLAPGLSAARLLRAAALIYRVREEGDKRPMAQALKELDAVLLKDSGDVRALRLRAEIRNDLEDFEGSRADLQSILRLEPGNDWARVELADLYCDYGRFDEAWPLIKRLETRFGREGWYWALRGRALATTGHRDKGLKALDRAAKLAPKDPVIAAWRGEALRVVSRFHEALKEFTRSLRLEKNFAYSYVWRGRLLLMLGRPAAALKDLNTLLKKDRRLTFAPIFRAEALFKLGRFAAAAKDLTAAYPQDPRQTWNPRVKEGGPPGDRAQALFADLNAAVAKHPRNAYVWAIRGRCLAAAGQLQAACADLDRALELKKNLPFALTARGHVRLQMGHAQEAFKDLNKVREGWAAAWAGQALVQMGRHRQALAYFDRALVGDDPRFAGVHAWKAEALEALGRAAEARSEAARGQSFLGLERGKGG
jgi:tetratricopeptide (TPR) repeat protein